jgi:hypothetical protein
VAGSARDVRQFSGIGALIDLAMYKSEKANPQGPAVLAEMFDPETGWLLDDGQSPGSVTECGVGMVGHLADANRTLDPRLRPLQSLQGNLRIARP